MILFAALCAVIAAWCLALRIAATAGTGRAIRFRDRVARSTPDHYQGRQNDFDEYGRPW